MTERLSPVEARVLGSLVEKSLTTPELYPLTLNSLVAACNQKTSRDPVMSLGHSEVEKVLSGLVERKFAGRIHERGARAAKYSHRIDALLASEDPKAVAAVTVLLLRGAQTPGEIKTRGERLHRFESTAEVEALMAELAGRLDGPVVARLPRQPGQKESRYRELFTEEAPAVTEVPQPRPQAAPAPEPGPDRVALLEERVSALESALRELQQRFAAKP
ncbi:MAG: YceH family protein [Elusimicrobia bacterium]|nr:YceH family protein [Elusimicrobiota bacterium]